MCSGWENVLSWFVCMVEKECLHGNKFKFCRLNKKELEAKLIWYD